MAQNVFILSAEEYAQVQGMAKRIEQLKSELISLSSVLAEAKRDCEGTVRELKVARAERDAEILLRQDVQEELSRCQQISAKRLETMNQLQKEGFNLKHRDRVYIVTNPKTGTVRICDPSKVDTYRRFGWTVSEEKLVDRPA